MKMPMLSIIIANYNYGHFIEEAIKSVVSQDGFDESELIIVDGGSKDGSVDVIKKYSDKITWWVSEPDKGQSDAFNKGFSHARGKFGCWLNADDIMLPGTLRAVLDEVKKESSCEWVTGGMIFADRHMRVRQARIGSRATAGMYSWAKGAGTTLVGGPSSFFSIACLNDVGGFDESLHYTMDGDLWLRFINAGMRLRHLNRYFWAFRIHDESKTSHSVDHHKNEKFESEDMRLRQKAGLNDSSVKRMHVRLRLYRIINGSLFRSALDTYRWRNQTVDAVFGK